MLNNFSSKCIKMTKRCAFGTSYSITYFNSGIKVRPSLGKACTNLCHVFGFVISTPGQGQQLLTGLLKKMVRRSTSSKGVNSDSRIQASLQTVEAVLRTQRHYVDAGKFPIFLGGWTWLESCRDFIPVGLSGVVTIIT